MTKITHSEYYSEGITLTFKEICIFTFYICSVKGIGTLFYKASNDTICNMSKKETFYGGRDDVIKGYIPISVKIEVSEEKKL